VSDQGVKRRIPAVVVAFVGLVGLALVLRWGFDETMSRHHEVLAGSTTEVVVRAELRDGAEHDLDEVIEGLVATCHLEVRSDTDPDDIEVLGEGRYRFVLTPALDDSDRLQLRGCLQDWRIDHLRADVESMREAS
jgi:hypothetical protein